MAAEAWKIAGQSKAAFEPIIFDKGIVKDFCLKNINRLLVSACDIDYLRKNIECLFSYKKSDALIPYIVFVLCENSNQEAELRSEIKKISDKVDSKKFYSLCSHAMQWLKYRGAYALQATMSIK